MSKKLLSCGGLYIDDETITETDGILSASGGGELPTVTSDDIGKFLSVVEVGSHTETATIIQEQAVTLNSGKTDSPSGQLAVGTYDFSSLIIGDTVELVIDGQEVVGDVIDGAAVGILGLIISNYEVGIVIDFDGGILLNSEESSITITISATATITVHEPGIDWAEVAPTTGGGLLSGVYNSTTKTLDKTWQEIYDAPGIILFEEVEEGDMSERRIYGISKEIMFGQGMYGVLISVIGGGDLGMFLTESADGYPVEYEGP